MRHIPLAAVDVASPPDCATLRGHLSAVPLPARTAALVTPCANVSAASDRVTAVVAAALRDLVEHLASDNTDFTCCQRAVSRLVGLGPGLTPTGDDLLVALAATCALLTGGDGLLPTATAERLLAAIAALPGGLTTDVAQHLLSASVAGRFPEPLAAFVTALGDWHADDATVAALAEQLAATGAHSGADWLAGVIALTRACVASERQGEAC